VDCDVKFAVVFGCSQVSSIIGKDIVELIPSVAVSDSIISSPQVCLPVNFSCCVFASVSLASMMSLKIC